MESNRDEALKCLNISQRHRDAGNLPSARKFAQKSINLYSTPEGVKLLQLIEDMIAVEASSTSGSNNEGSSSTGAETHPSSSGTRHRHARTSASTSDSASGTRTNGTASGSGGEKREYTQEQAAVVSRVRSCKITEYYEILSVKKDCEEAEIKKAYRKVCSFLKSFPFFLFNQGLFVFCYSSPFNSILTRTAPLEQMRHSKVRLL